MPGLAILISVAIVVAAGIYQMTTPARPVEPDPRRRDDPRFK